MSGNEKTINDFDIDNDQDIDYSKAQSDPSIVKKIKEKQIINKEIDKLNNINDIDIERSILYLLMTEYSNDILTAITNNHIKAEYFINDISNIVFNLIYKIGVNGVVDYMIVKNEFNKIAKDEKQINEFKALFNFKGFVPNKELFFEYTNLLFDNYEKNQLNNLVKTLEKAIIRKDEGAIDYLKHEIANFELSKKNDNPDLGLVTNDYLGKQAIEWVEGGYKTQNVILKTGFKTFDNQIGGFEKGQFIVFGARPSVGKSISLINTMYSMTKEGRSCLYVSAEMYAKYIYSRWQSIDLEINNNKIKAPFKLSAQEKKRVLAFNEKFKTNNTARFYFENVVTARDIEIIARQIKSQNGGKLDAIFVDYLGKLYPNNLNTNRSRNEIVTDISKELFELAGKLNIVMITASQLSRASSKDADQASLVKPKMSDLKDSGSIEADADLIIGLTRNVDEGINCVTEDMKTDFNWHIIKNRNGELGDFTFDFHPTIQKLVDRYNVFEKQMNAPENKEKKDEAIEQNIKIKDILKDEEGDNFAIGTDDIFGN